MRRAHTPTTVRACCSPPPRSATRRPEAGRSLAHGGPTRRRDRRGKRPRRSTACPSPSRSSSPSPWSSPRSPPPQPKRRDQSRESQRDAAARRLSQADGPPRRPRVCRAAPAPGARDQGDDARRRQCRARCHAWNTRRDLSPDGRHRGRTTALRARPPAAGRPRTRSPGRRAARRVSPNELPLGT